MDLVRPVKGWCPDSGAVVDSCQTTRTTQEAHCGPIYRLPTELLLEILRYCQFPWTSDPYHFDPRLRSGIRYPVNHSRFWMQLVCNLWRQCIAGTPSFWSMLELNAHLPSDVFDKLLQRSADVPLAISLTNSPHLVPLLCDQQHRIRRLAIDCLYDHAVVEEGVVEPYLGLLTLPAPIYEFHLLLRPWVPIVSEARGRAALPRLFAGGTSLTQLHLRRFVPWPTNSLPNLTHLSLGCTFIDNGNGFHDFASFLEGSRKLEELIFEYVGCAVNIHTGREINLPHLRLVILIDCHVTLIKSMIRTVIPSNNATLDFRWSLQPPDPVAWEDMFSPRAVFLSQVDLVGELCLWSTEDSRKELALRCSDSTLRSSLTFHIHMGHRTTNVHEKAVADAIFHSLPVALRLSTVKRLRVQLASRFMNIALEPGLSILLRTMSDVEHVTLLLYETVDEKTAVDLLWHNLSDLQTWHVAKRYDGELPSTWMPIPTLHVAMSQALNGRKRVRKVTCSTISPLPRARPFFGMGWGPEDVIVGDSRVVDLVDELVLDNVNYDKDLLDHPKISLWDRNETVP